MMAQQEEAMMMQQAALGGAAAGGPALEAAQAQGMPMGAEGGVPPEMSPQDAFAAGGGAPIREGAPEA